jgi:hypothetical protein
MRRLVLVALLLASACEDKATPVSAKVADRAPAEAVAAVAELPRAEPTPAPDPELPEIIGARRLGKLEVQTCEDIYPCPDLVADEGIRFCEGLELSGKGWRLPTRDELDSLSGVDGLQELTGYHFSATPYEEDLKQVWIVDPSQASQATTIPRDRKPFRIRCVREVPA